MSRLREEFRVIPRGALLLAVLVAGGVASLILVFAEESRAERLIIGAVVGSFLCVYILLIGYVFADSKRRGMRHVLWTLVAAFVPNAIGVLAYFLLREPVLTPCRQCGTSARREFAFCPSCGATLHRACPECRRPVDLSWSHCAHCGSVLSPSAAPGSRDEGSAPETEDAPDAT